MGELTTSGQLEGAALRAFMAHLLEDLRALEWMIDHGMIETSIRRIGAEQEVFLVDQGWRPAKVALEVLDTLADPHYTTELALFNMEMNLDPYVLVGDCLSQMEDHLSELLGRARAAAARHDAHVVLAGILPTIRKSDLELDSITPMERYLLLNQVTQQMRGGPYELRLKGTDDLNLRHDNVMVEACNCSFQVHFQVGAEEFPNLYNVAQVATAPVLAAATNSPILFGRRLWRETRIALFQQAVDTRSSSDHLRERSPRVQFGERWVRKSVLELFQEDICRYRVIFGTSNREDPFASLEAGVAPKLYALRLHNGTVWRWNRACYGVTNGKPHLRIENRVLPSGPTVRDEIANAAFWFGLIGGLSYKHPDIASNFDFGTARGNFNLVARNGLNTQLEWIDGKTHPAHELILKELLPIAAAGLEAKGICRDDIDRYLGTIAARVARRRTGSQWMLDSLRAMEDDGSLSERLGALTAAMVARQKGGTPVSDWEIASIDETGGWSHNFRNVEQYMTTDIFTVHDDEPLDLVLQIMNWQRIRHVPVENAAGLLVGLVSYRTLLRVLGESRTPREQLTSAVSDVMKRDLVTVSPETLTLDAIRLMRDHGIGCLPVVKGGRLVGIITERDFMDLSRELIQQELAPSKADGAGPPTKRG